MEIKKLSGIIISSCLSVLVFASPASAAVPAIVGHMLIDGILSTIIYSVIGIIMAFASYKVVDILTPGDLGKEIAEEKNVALAILAGTTIVGVCIIIAAAIAG